MQRNYLNSLIWIATLILLGTNASATLQQQPAPAKSAGAKQVTEINKGWEFRLAPPDPNRGIAGATPVISVADAEALNRWLPAEVPGLVHTDLLRNKVIPDPFYRDNETRLQWIGLEDWQYRTSINVPDTTLARRHVDLVFKGLDTYATVYVNDTQVLSANNQFREWRVDAKRYLKAGDNRLLIVFRSPINEVLPKIENLPYHLPTPSGPRIASEKGIPTDIYTRKAPYNFGWDWGPRFVTLGVWKPVLLESWDDAAIRDLRVRQNEVTEKVANLSADLEVVADADTAATVAVSYQPPSGKGADGRAERNVQLHAGMNRVELPLEIQNPARWFPNGYGAQDLYRFHATVAVKGANADEANVRAGLRSLELRREPDQWGKSFEFVVNGIPVFGKGADTIPFDSFPTRVTTEQYRRILGSARDANMNMIRSWGGGYYESDEFFDICDELGIMVWQDFMFGGGMYPGDAPFIDNVREEAIYQVKRLRNHPSIVIWCGNNESEYGWFNWGDRKALKESVTPDTRERLWQDYMRLFDGVLRRVVAEYGQPVEYWPSSPSANFEDAAGSPASGDMHYWEVWHARAPIENYKLQFPRFMSEYGFQSFPEMQTIKTFSLPEDWDIESRIMLAHQKNVGGNARIHDYMLNYFGEPKDFASFLYVSQVLQAEAIKVGAEHLRRQRPRTMGSLYWQLNDCWPVASWASIDYYGHWKALQYYARRFYNDLLVSPNVESGSTSIYVVSDRTTPTPAKLRVRLMNYAGNVVQEKNQDVTIEPLSSRILLQLPTDTLLTGKNDHFLVDAELLVDNKAASRNLLFLNRMKDVTLPKPRLTTTIDQAGQNYRVRVQTNALARDVYVSFGDLDATTSDNYIDMLPGETAEITVTSKASLADLRKSMQVISLVDAIVPGSGNRTATTTASRR